MSFYFKIKTSSRFNGFYRNPAGLPSFTPARVAPTRVAPTSVAPARVAPARVAAELGLPLAGLPRQGCPRQGCPRQGDIALAGLPCQGSAPPHVAYSGIVHLLCDGPTHLVLFARWRGFVVLLYEVLFSCRAGLQARRALSKFSINYLPGFPISSHPRQGPARVAPAKVDIYIYIYIYATPPPPHGPTNFLCFAGVCLAGV